MEMKTLTKHYKQKAGTYISTCKCNFAFIESSDTQISTNICTYITVIEVVEFPTFFKEN